ncbi:HdeA/HdeB family chaperone [Acuticoccus sp.]|uniref:HdeA/HdeB family chaperone n=1 Tax=Acuticoccus sp. TaxID=1904378 RepID=UPI003B51A4BA
MNRLLATVALLVAFVVPTFAQTAMDVSTMTCADFAGMDSEGQMEAMEAMNVEMAATATTGTEMSEEETMAAMMEECQGNDEMMAMDAMTSAMQQ